jgi:hypothetical protein
MIPFLIIGIGLGWFFSRKESPSFKDTPSVTAGHPLPTVDLTPHLNEFKRLINRGHRPSKWLVNGAIEEAYLRGNWSVVKAIAENYVDDPKLPAPSTETPKTENIEDGKDVTPETANIEAPKFEIANVSPPIDPTSGMPIASKEDWQMFVSVSRVAPETFDSENSVGMFRQNKKRLAKMGISDVTTPIKQYDAFENEVIQMIGEGKELSRLHVAMPIDVDGETFPITLSGLVAVMRIAGTKNAGSWLDSPDERRKFPNTTEAFKKANGCF